MKHWSIIRICYNVTATSYQWLEFFVKFAKHGASNPYLPKIWPLMPNTWSKNYTTYQQGTKLDLAPPLSMNQIWHQIVVELLLVGLRSQLLSMHEAMMPFSAPSLKKLWPFSHFSPLRGLDPTLLVSFSNVKFQHCACEKVQQSKFLRPFCHCGVQGSISMKLQWQQKKNLLPLWSFGCRHEGSLATFFFSHLYAVPGSIGAKVHWQHLFSIASMEFRVL